MTSRMAVTTLHDDIAQAMHLEMRYHGHGRHGEIARSGVLGVAARLATVFAHDPDFDHDHFLKIVLKGRES